MTISRKFLETHCIMGDQQSDARKPDTTDEDKANAQFKDENDEMKAKNNEAAVDPLQRAQNSAEDAQATLQTGTNDMKDAKTELLMETGKRILQMIPEDIKPYIISTGEEVIPKDDGDQDEMNENP
jgi:hypothetical protein